MKPKISYIIITARADYPTIGLPALHLWQPTLKTLASQSFREFEWILVDVFWEERKDYFNTINTHDLRIKHIPAAPNPWHSLGLVQTCHQFNKGIIHADGELLFFDADSSMLPPTLLENLWRHYQDGYFTSLGFGSDVTFAPELQERQLGEAGQYTVKTGTIQGTSAPSQTIVPTDWIHNLEYGYQGKIIMDHRYRKLFENTAISESLILPDWYFGISTASLDAALKINGFDLSFDGDSALNDVDFGNRLWLAGHRKLAMFRDSYLVEAFAGPYWHPKMKIPRPEIKCNYALMRYNRLTLRQRVNEGPIDPGKIQNTVCRHCNLIVDCQKFYPHRAPFWNTKEPDLVKHWLQNMNEQADLSFERQLRLEGDPQYAEGTFINVV